MEDIVDLTSVIKLIRIKLPEGEEINFKPGQYVQLKAPLYEGNDEEVYRAYSIASSPKEKKLYRISYWICTRRYSHYLCSSPFKSWRFCSHKWTLWRFLLSRQ